MEQILTPKTVRVPVSLTEEQHERLTQAAERLGLTISAFIRMAALKEAGDA